MNDFTETCHKKHDFYCNRLKNDIQKMTWCDDEVLLDQWHKVLNEDIFSLVDVHRKKIFHNKHNSNSDSFSDIDSDSDIDLPFCD